MSFADDMRAAAAERDPSLAKRKGLALVLKRFLEAASPAEFDAVEAWLERLGEPSVRRAPPEPIL